MPKFLLRCSWELGAAVSKSDPLAPSMKLPNWVMPTTWMRETSTGVGDGTNTAFIGLSDIPTPTIGWSTTTLMPSDSSWPRGPTPLSISTCGLPIAPADTMISFLDPLFRYARCFLPAESRNTTPCAVGLAFPVLKKKKGNSNQTLNHRELGILYCCSKQWWYYSLVVKRLFLSEI